MKKRLTDKQIMFCEEYLIDFNGTRAYKAAYPSVKKDSSARSNASRLQTKANIEAYLKERKDEMTAKLEITPERTLRAFARRAYFDPRQLVGDDGKLKPLDRMDRDTAAVVTEIKIHKLNTKTRKVDAGDEAGQRIETLEETLVTVKWDKGDAARDALAKYLGLFEKDNSQRQANLEIYNQARAELEKELVEEAFNEIAEQNKQRDPDDPRLI